MRLARRWQRDTCALLLVALVAGGCGRETAGRAGSDAAREPIASSSAAPVAATGTLAGPAPVDRHAALAAAGARVAPSFASSAVEVADRVVVEVKLPHGGGQLDPAEVVRAELDAGLVAGAFDAELRDAGLAPRISGYSVAATHADGTPVPDGVITGSDGPFNAEVVDGVRPLRDDASRSAWQAAIERAADAAAARRGLAVASIDVRFPHAGAAWLSFTLRDASRAVDLLCATNGGVAEAVLLGDDPTDEQLALLTRSEGLLVTVRDPAGQLVSTSAKLWRFSSSSGWSALDLKRRGGCAPARSPGRAARRPAR